MNRSSLIEKLLVQARRLAGLSGQPSKAARQRTTPPGEELVFLTELSAHPPANNEPIPTVASAAPSIVKHTALPASPPVGKDVGARLYLLDHDKLYIWARNHWDSLPEIEAVCDAFFHNWKTWRQEHRHDWAVADHFFACQDRLNALRSRAVRAQVISTADSGPSRRRENAPATSANAADQCLPYSRLLENVLISWNDRATLAAHAETLRQMLRKGTTNLPSDLRPRLILDLIEIRLHALLPDVDIIPVSRKPKTPEPERPKRPHGLPPGCPEWPAEAEREAAVALNSETFFHATGMLKFMGYGVGKKSLLSADRRRAILTYVFLGHLPLVNDAHYMQEWGRPRSNRRLRKIANSLAAFARNARRKKASSWNHAINGWEADLAFLKKRYYDRRVRDWKWPETVRKPTK